MSTNNLSMTSGFGAQSARERLRAFQSHGLSLHAETSQLSGKIHPEECRQPYVACIATRTLAKMLREDKESDMTKTMNKVSISSFALAVVVSVLTIPQLSVAATNEKNEIVVNALAQDSNPATIAASARLDKKQYREIKVSVEHGIATLTGTVDLYEYKADAEKRVRRVPGVTAVRNLVDVSGPSIPDQELQAKLQEKLTYDRVGYGNTFNAISLTVESGIVTLGGHARTDMDKDSALALVSTQPGVKDVIEEIDVDPVSIMDDQTRIAVARAIYGYPSLNRYSIDPAKPIRISVQNGHVELYGIVDSRADKDVAFIRANGVPWRIRCKELPANCRSIGRDTKVAPSSPAWLIERRALTLLNLTVHLGLTFAGPSRETRTQRQEF